MTKKPRENRVPIMMSETELKEIDDWRFENRIATRSDAIRRLVQIGLLFDENAAGIAEAFIRLNDTFGDDMIAAAEKLTTDPDRTKAESDYIAQTFTTTYETIENLQTLLHRINLVMAPAQAAKAQEPYDSAIFGVLAAKADSMAKLIDQKIANYEFRKKRGLLQGGDEKDDEK